MASPLSSLFKWPVWVLQLGTGAKSFADNPLIGSRRLNHWGLHRLRLRAAHGLAAWRRWLLSGGISREDRAAFAAQGYVEWRDVLPPEAFARMRTAILEQAWPTREMMQGHAITRHVAVDKAMLQAVPDLAALLRSRRWRGLMRYVAATRSEPLYYIQTIITHSDWTGDDPQTSVHADAFHPSMKAWLFLGDVALEDGPLTYVAGSQKLTPERLAWEEAKALQAPAGLDRLSARGSFRIETAELQSLDLPQPTSFAVPANTLVVADMFGFHARGAATRPSVRVELWAYSRRNPFLPWTGLDLGSLPGLADRRIGIMWWLKDRFPHIFGLPWLKAGLKRPDER
jgi:hypothetical protein